MQATLTSMMSWVSNEALDTPEPVVLLILGALFLVLSFRVRARRDVADAAAQEAPSPRVVTAARPVSRPSSALAPQEAR